ncbi:MAG: hypothetical protein SAL70_35115 [Scytonema sp. PMC 1070.18]|nr:hypothetical protein [Scytonema sp. PMC 1070.18]
MNYSVLWNRATFRFFLLLLLLITILFIQPQIARAETSKLPEKCSFGVFISSLHDLSLLDKSFGANFWLWSHCNSQDTEPLKIDILNAKSVETSAEATDEKANIYWSQLKVNTVLRHNWNVKNFPFDRHKLVIECEHSFSDVNKLVYVVDKKNSKYSDQIQLEGFRITGFEIQEKKYHYPTNFGDPQQSDGSTYSRLLITIKIARNGLTEFFKFSSSTYIAFALSFLSFFMNFGPTDMYGTRISLLVGCLFAVVLNLQASESLLGRTNGLTLIDIINISTLLYISIAVAVTSAAHFYFCNGREKFSRLVNRLICNLSSIIFIVANAIMICSSALSS